MSWQECPAYYTGPLRGVCGMRSLSNQRCMKGAHETRIIKITIRTDRAENTAETNASGHAVGLRLFFITHPTLMAITCTPTYLFILRVGIIFSGYKSPHPPQPPHVFFRNFQYPCTKYTSMIYPYSVMIFFSPFGFINYLAVYMAPERLLQKSTGTQGFSRFWSGGAYI